jgi:hypothetical protein
MSAWKAGGVESEPAVRRDRLSLGYALPFGSVPPLDRPGTAVHPGEDHLGARQRGGNGIRRAVRPVDSAIQEPNQRLGARGNPERLHPALK